MSVVSLAPIVSLAKRRGFVFPSSSVYGGLSSSWDYGPLGVELKNNIKRAWWRAAVYDRDDMEGLDSAILMNRLVWRHSGHEKTFSDPMTDCRACKARPRADQLFAAQKEREPQDLEDINRAIRAGELRCSACGSAELTAARPFNLMFRTHLGPVEGGDESLAYLRPETAQGIFVNFANVLSTMRRKLPFGIAQIGKAFRNEITPGQFIFRTREFEQMEIEYFVAPGDDESAHQAWIDARVAWYLELGIDSANLRQREQEPHELAHYAKRCVDLEYRFPMGWSELEGIANRGDFDLRAHSRSDDNRDSVGELNYYDQDKKEHVVPFVIEPSAGADRATLAFLCDAYEDALVTDPPPEDCERLAAVLESFAKSAARREEMSAAARERLAGMARALATGLPGSLPDLPALLEDGEASSIEVLSKVRGVGQRLLDRHTRTVLHFHPRLAPIKAAVFPLKKNNAQLVEAAREIQRELQRGGIRAVYDDTGAIGKLYRRQDEIGTPWCVTVDFQTLEDETVTVRDRDTMEQERSPRGALVSMFQARLA